VRILFLTHRLPYAPNRGDRIRAYHLLRLLAASQEVHLVSLIHDAAELSHVATLRDLTASTAAAPVERWRNLAPAAVALAGTRPLTHSLLHSSAMRPILNRLVRDARPDVVIAYCSGMARYCLEPPLMGFPFIFDMVDVDSEKWRTLAGRTAGIKKWVYRREAVVLGAFEHLAVSRAIATTVVSERERSVFAGSRADRIHVVPNGVDVLSFVPGSAPAGEPAVIFCGVFDYEPNEFGALWLASDVWPLVTRVEPRAQLTLVGMNPTRAVRNLARSDSSIRVTGTVLDVRPYLWQSAVAVAPLHVARGIQNKVLEAIAAGLPCVVTPQVLEGLPSAVRPACLTASDAQTFAASIVDLLKKEPHERRRIAQQADLSSLTWSATLGRFLDLIATVR
jgi:sugar transferase (PEP-CTERM/EpsH1 system associated)